MGLFYYILLYFIALFAKSSKTKALIKLEISKKITNKKDGKIPIKYLFFLKGEMLESGIA